MSDALTLIQTAYGHFGRGDVPALLQLLTPDVEWEFHGDSAAPYTTRAVGPSQVGEWFAEVAKADDIRRFEPQRFFAGPDHVTVIGSEHTIARATGEAFECPWVHVFEVRDGRVSRFWGMLDSEQAAAARSGAA
jgi:ketosteroid isomerase-like protein